MNNNLRLTFILTPLLLAVWFSGSTLNAHAEWVLILDEETYSIASDGERLYATTEEGIYYSRDDGDTWLPTDFPFWCNMILVTHDAAYGYAGYDDGLYRSDDHGRTWKKIDRALERETHKNEHSPKYFGVHRYWSRATAPSSSVPRMIGLVPLYLTTGATLGTTR